MEESGQKSVKLDMEDLDYLVWTMQLPKEHSVILLETLKEKNLMEESIDVHTYDHRERPTLKFYDWLKNGAYYVKDVDGLFGLVELKHDPSDFQLEIKFEQSKKRLECTLTHKQNKNHPLKFLESHNGTDDPFETLKQALEKADYKRYRWELKGDFSAVSDARRSRRFTVINGRI